MHWDAHFMLFTDKIWETFDISHAFRLLSITKLLTPKNSPFFAHPVFSRQYFNNTTAFKSVNIQAEIADQYSNLPTENN